MKIEYIDESWLKEEIRRAVLKHLPSVDYKVFLFGSRVRGDNFERSDIDIGIKGPKPLPTQTKLDIEEDLENLPILYPIDLVDFGKNASDTFKKHALKNVEYLN